MSIETLIAQAVRSGDLTALTVWPAAKGWQCNVRRRHPDGAEGWTCISASDPIDGIGRALAGSPAPAAQEDSEDIFG